MNKNHFLRLFFTLLITFFGTPSALDAAQKQAGSKPGFPAGAQAGGDADLLSSLQNMPPEELEKLQKELETEIADMVEKMPPAEQEAFFNTMEKLNQIPEDQITRFVSGQMEDDELERFLSDIAPETQEPKKPVEDKKPEPQKVPAKVALPSSKQQEMLTLISDIIARIDSFNVKAASVPELPAQVDRWMKKRKVVTTGKSWHAMQTDIDGFVQKLRVILEREPKSNTHRHLDTLAKQETLVNNLKNLRAQLNRLEPKIEEQGMFGLEKLSAGSKDAMQKTINQLSEALYTTKIPDDFAKVFAEFEPIAKKLQEEEKKIQQKALEETKRPRQYGRVTTAGKEADDLGFPSFKPDNGYAPSHQPGFGGQPSRPGAPAGRPSEPLSAGKKNGAPGKPGDKNGKKDKDEPSKPGDKTAAVKDRDKTGKPGTGKKAANGKQPDKNGKKEMAAQFPEYALMEKAVKAAEKGIKEEKEIEKSLRSVQNYLQVGEPPAEGEFTQKLSSKVVAPLKKAAEAAQEMRKEFAKQKQETQFKTMMNSLWDTMSTTFGPILNQLESIEKNWKEVKLHQSKKTLGAGFADQKTEAEKFKELILKSKQRALKPEEKKIIESMLKDEFSQLKTHGEEININDLIKSLQSPEGLAQLDAAIAQEKQSQPKGVLKELKDLLAGFKSGFDEKSKN